MIQMVRSGAASRLLPLAMLLAAAAPALAADPAAHRGSGEIRGDRYCEVLPVYREQLHLKIVVYNTIGHNDCPPELWRALDADTVADELGAMRAVMNGPRVWAMDEIVGRGPSVDGEPKTIGGIEMSPRATITMPLRDLLFGSEPYRTRTIERDTVFVYRPGTPVFELTDADGNVYVMQTFSQIVDPGLKMEDLPALGARLELPEGWRYGMRTLDAELRLEAEGEAVVVQDDLTNTYQRR